MVRLVRLDKGVIAVCRGWTVRSSGKRLGSRTTPFKIDCIRAG